jgi:hypothetical protein
VEILDLHIPKSPDRQIYWIVLTVALGVNGSVGAVAPMFCQMALPELVAKARPPVVPQVVGIAVA